MRHNERYIRERRSRPEEVFNKQQKGKHAHALVELFLNADRLGTDQEREEFADTCAQLRRSISPKDVVIGGIVYRYHIDTKTIKSNGRSHTSIVFDVDRVSQISSPDQFNSGASRFAVRLYTEFEMIGGFPFYLDGNIHAFADAQNPNHNTNTPGLCERVSVGQNNPMTILTIQKELAPILPKREVTVQTPAA